MSCCVRARFAPSHALPLSPTSRSAPASAEPALVAADAEAEAAADAEVVGGGG